MPADVAIAITAIVLAFVGFAGVLAWADHFTNSAKS